MTTRSTARHWSESLPDDACRDALEWSRSQPSAAVAWRDCRRGDWMLWLLGKSSEPGSDARKKLVLAACECARLALPYVTVGENHPRIAIETAEKWARREDGVTLKQVRDATDAGASTYTAYAAAADAADAAAYNAAYIAYTAAAAYTAYAAFVAAADAKTKTLRQCADIVRDHYPEPPRLT